MADRSTVAQIAEPERGLRRVVIGTGMIPRGEVSLIFAQIGLTSGLLTAGLFNSVTVMVIITALVTPLLLRAQLTQGTPEARRGEYELVVDAPMDESIRTRGDGE